MVLHVRLPSSSLHEQSLLQWLSYNWGIGTLVGLKSKLALQLERMRKMNPLTGSSQPRRTGSSNVSAHHERSMLKPMVAERPLFQQPHGKEPTLEQMTMKPTYKLFVGGD
jgi:hypothetical protein